MKKVKGLSALLLALVMAVSLIGCGDSGANGGENTAPPESAPSDTAAPGEGGDAPDTLYIGSNGTSTFFGNFDPTGSFANPGIVSYSTAYLIYDQLFYANSDGEYVSRIVDSYDWADDTTLNITLKDNIYFSNGDQMTGEDVLYSLMTRQKGIRPDYYKKINIDKSSADGLNVTFIFDAPYAAYMAALDFNIGNKAYLESLDAESVDWYDPSYIVGSGPYAVTSCTPNTELVFELRDDYWGAAYGYTFDVRSYVVYCYSDQSTMAIDLETGAIDLAFDLARTDYDRLGSSDGFTVGLSRGNANFIIFFDSNNNEYLKDVNVRKAICHALDVEAIAKACMGSYAVVADSIFTSDELGYVGGLTYKYDPDYAKQILADAGYAEGEITLKFVISQMTPHDALSEAVMGYLDKIGITVEIEILERMSYFANTRVAGVTDLYLYQFGTGNAGGEPAIHLDDVKPASGHAVMAREGYNDIILSAEQSLDPATRIELYQQLQNLFYENYDGVPMFEFVTGYAYNSDVISNVNYIGGGASSVWLFDMEF